MGIRQRTNRRGVRAPSAFTLVELLVVVSIIALLISILLPSLRRARDAAKTTVCGATLHGLGMGISTYASEEKEWIPGTNTSGFELWLQSIGAGVADKLQNSRLPTQTFDWITPVLRTSTTLPRNRAKKFQLLFDEYKCAAVNFKSRPFANSKPPDDALFKAEEDKGQKFFATSYLMPAQFQYWGQNDSIVLGWSPQRIPRNAQVAGDTWEVVTPRFRSRIDRVGPPAEKVAAADGTRFLPADGLLDFDHDPKPTWFGAFTDGGPFWRKSTAYGDTAGTSSNAGGQIPLSYRHNLHMEAVFFDGHTEKLSQRQSHKIDYWYPRGGILKNVSEVFTDFAVYPVDYVVR